jgi:hypothetical protein
MAGEAVAAAEQIFPALGISRKLGGPGGSIEGANERDQLRDPELRPGEPRHLRSGDSVLDRKRQIGVGVAVIEDPVREIRPSAALPFASVAFGAAKAIELAPLGEIGGRGLEHGEKKPPHGDGIVDSTPLRYKPPL